MNQIKQLNMKLNIKPGIFLFTAIVLLMVVSSKVYSQRCGDGILFNINDNSMTSIDSSRIQINGYYYDSYYWDKDAEVKPGMKLKYPEFYQVQKDTIYISKLNKHVEWKANNQFYIRTFCSMLLVSVKVTLNDKTMQLDIYNIPGDIPLKTSGIVFAPGKYDINLNGYIDMDKYTKDSDGKYIISFDKFQPAE